MKQPVLLLVVAVGTLAMVLLGGAAILIVSASQADDDDMTETIERDMGPTETAMPMLVVTEASLPPLAVIAETTPSPAFTPTRTLIPQPAFANDDRTPVPTTQSVTNESAFEVSAANVGSPNNVGAGCVVTPSVDVNIFVRRYPLLNSASVGYLGIGQTVRAIAVASSAGDRWYAANGGWVSASVVRAEGGGCGRLPNASNVRWGSSVGHVDHQSGSAANYTRVTDIRVEEFMRWYDFLIFANGTIWYNPNR